ncbi:hypothetical protein UCRPC4_g06072 [Phaeomoniella chlamydospora]|uniref:Conserved oligomeric Golgi complex subunit 2 n=1 Tax=Phaeomoniella chlamydospora TaxID=158046 RepID=A0A0G2E0K4_PHACM|nr:hypothetical protein UCRPC4_g06072 [Phaeomoniella chlamydospora]
MSRFYFEDDLDPDSRTGSDDETSLPFPAPLSRDSFAKEGDFSPSDFLTSLSSRHQTLEDLREELRSLSSALNNELLDLVNENYSDFLGLGKQLKGGDERVEEIRVGLLGFQREVEKLRAGIDVRRKEMAGAIEEKRHIGRDIALGRRLLEVEERLGDLEDRLLLRETTKTNGDTGIADFEHNWDSDLDIDSEGDESSEDGDRETAINGDGALATPELKRLRRNVENYQVVSKLMELYGAGHPFIEAQQGRLEKIRSTLEVDLRSLQESEDGQAKGKPQQELARLDQILRANDKTKLPLR